MKELRAVDIQMELQRLVRSSSQKAVARALRVSPSYINDVLHGRRDVTGIAERLGYQSVVRYYKLPRAGTV